MTSSNIVDASRHNGHAGNHEKTPEEIQLEIARTKTQITEDLLALSERLSPQHLRESAREVMRDAREEAKEVLRDAKDEVIGSLRDAKDRALTSVSETVSDIGVQAKRAGAITVDFVSANAVAVSLLSLGAGYLVWALRNRRRNQEGEYAYRYEHYSYPDESYGANADRYAIEGDNFGAEHGGRTARAQGMVRGVASRASRAVDAAREQVRSAASQVGENAGRLSHRASDGIRHAAVRTREVASDNRLAVIGLTIAAGLGVGLLLPVGNRPRRAIRRASERVWDEAEDLGRRVGGYRRGARAADSYDLPDLTAVVPSGSAY